MKALLKSRKFWAAVWAAAINVATFVVAHYFPAQKELFTVCIVSLDGVFAVVIGGIAYEDAAALKAGTHITQKGQ
jgi:hypothetical protein